MYLTDFYGTNLKPWEVEDFIQKEAMSSGLSPSNATNLEDKAISMIGRPLYEAFVKGYTLKQWKTDPKILPKEIFQRLPIRSSYASGYFVDSHEGLPKNGYYSLFHNMTKNPLIKVMLNTNWFDVRHLISPSAKVFYSGPIDAYFDNRFGKLEYRSLEFKCETHSVQDYQGVSMLNFADIEVPYTRIHEFKHLHPERKEVMRNKTTLICFEYPKTPIDGEEEYYPVNTEKNQKIFEQYASLVAKDKNLIIAGRLGSYRYFDMDKVIDNALACFDNFLRR
jgi:UDP-galactopyranose mutase